MKLTTAKIAFIIITFSYWSTSTLSTANDDYFAIENYMYESLQSLCNDEISLNFSNAVISEIKRDFISSPVITCLNLMNNNIEKIGRGAFEKLSNLTQLFLSNNRLHNNELFNFGGHDKLQVLIMNYATRCDFHSTCFDKNKIQIFGKYPNLEILSLSQNYFDDLTFDQKSPFMEFHLTTLTTSQNWIPFPKLKILDLSENDILGTNFVQLLSNNLYFLDLHGNSLRKLNLNQKGNKLFALNLDKNKFDNIRHYGSGQSIPNEEHQKHQRPDSSEIRRATTQSSSTVEYRLEQRSSSGGEDVSQASVSGEMQSTTMQNLLIGGPLSKRMKSDSANLYPQPR
ncbi:PREDICTED: uncharacterized protein LOC108756338 isoform X3 [Trachymyrmex septentrionalis]|uniref:uncharacterized protein LOC108756338 isoform X3 n=1 Tax=Trachymyrmex septentrionalis TaxID=34720 RepID=UPI00084F0EB6|nr:PREDICTED: uncharacterized protein LOC108756338 isoform X3 [Trachymyrmex septentrionalis]